MAIKLSRKKIESIRIQEAACGLRGGIQIKGISVRDGDRSIIEDINLHIHCGKTTAIIGRNGAGKSTLMKAILGEIKHQGSVELMNLSNQTIDKLRIGYVPQHLNIERNTPISVYDLFAGLISNSPIFFWKSASVYKRIKEQLSVFEAQDLIDKEPVICRVESCKEYYYPWR